MPVRSRHRHPDRGRLLNDDELTTSRHDRLTVVAAAWLGCEPENLSIARATGGRSTPVYRVDDGERTAFLRLSECPGASLGPEALAHEVALSQGARVPAVIGYEPHDPVLDRSVMLTTTIPGASLADETPPGLEQVLDAAGADLARIGRISVAGFGWVRRDDPLPTRLAAPFATWEAFAADLTSLPLDRWFDPATLRQIVALAGIAPADTRTAILAHGDFDPSHIFADRGRYSGIIDFGEMRGAEQTFDLGHLALHAPAALPSVLDGYASVTPLPPDRDRQIAASAMRIGWFRLTQSSARSNPAYAAQLVEAMSRLALKS